MILNERYEYNPSTDRLGKGGFGSVFKAYDLIEKRTIALKFVPQSKLPERYSLLEETERIRQLDHINLVKYYDFFVKEYETVSGEIDIMQIGVMEYINGGDLGAFMKMEIAKSQARIYPILLGIMRGLEYLHQRRIIHRDIKPQNILLKLDGGGIIPKLADFGISKQMQGELTSVSAPVGTFEYMSPEQLGRSDAKLSPSTDIWSFGVLSYQLFTGRLPYGSRRQGDSDGQIIANILDRNFLVDFSDIPEPYRPVVKRCLQQDHENRYESISEIMEILSASKAPEQNISLSTTLPESSNKLADTHLEFNTQTQLPGYKQENQGGPLNLSESKPPSDKTTLLGESAIVSPPSKAKAPKRSTTQRRAVSQANLIVMILLLFSALGWGAYLFLSKAPKSVISQNEPSASKISEPSDSLDTQEANTRTSIQARPNLNTGPSPSLEVDNPSLPAEEVEPIEESELDLETFPENPENEGIEKPRGTKPTRPQLEANRRPKRPNLSPQERLAREFEETITRSTGTLVKNKQGKWGFYDRQGKLLIPCVYEDMSYPQEGLAAVLSRGKWGYINLQNQIKIPFQYDTPGNFYQGQAKVSYRGRAIVIDKRGTCLSNCF